MSIFKATSLVNLITSLNEYFTIRNKHLDDQIYELQSNIVSLQRQVNRLKVLTCNLSGMKTVDDKKQLVSKVILSE